jgi:hypothetical protein
MPLPTPTNEDINFVREAAGELDFDLISSLIDELNDDQWVRALDLVDFWNRIDPGAIIGLKGGREGVRLETQEKLDDIRARIRLLLGLPELRDMSTTGGMATVGVLTEFRW